MLERGHRQAAKDKPPVNSGAVPPREARMSHIRVSMLQHFKFSKSYDSEWVVWNPFFDDSEDPAPRGLGGLAYWAAQVYDPNSASTHPAAYDGFGCSFQWVWGPSGTAGAGPFMRLGQPQTGLGGGSAITQNDLAIGDPGWGQMLTDAANLSGMLAWFHVPCIELMIERLPDTQMNTNTEDPDNTNSVPGQIRNGNLNLGKFYLAPWSGDPLSFSPTTGAPLKFLLTGNDPQNIWTAVKSTSFLYGSEHNRLAPNTTHADWISCTTHPYQPVVVESGNEGFISVSGYSPNVPVSIEEWATNTTAIQGYTHKVMWVNDAGMSAIVDADMLTQLATCRYRIKFRATLKAWGAKPFDEFAAYPTVSALVKQKLAADMTAATVLGEALLKDKKVFSDQLAAEQKAAGFVAPPSTPVQAQEPDSDDETYVHLKKLKLQRDTSQASQQQRR